MFSIPVCQQAYLLLNVYILRCGPPIYSILIVAWMISIEVFYIRIRYGVIWLYTVGWRKMRPTHFFMLFNSFYLNTEGRDSCKYIIPPTERRSHRSKTKLNFGHQLLFSGLRVTLMQSLQQFSIHIFCYFLWFFIVS